MRGILGLIRCYFSKGMSGNKSLPLIRATYRKIAASLAKAFQFCVFRSVDAKKEDLRTDESHLGRNESRYKCLRVTNEDICGG